MSDDEARIKRVEAMSLGVSATVRTARGLAEAGRPIDVAGLDRMVGVLCAHVLDLSHYESRGFRERLRGIGGELDGLVAALGPPP